MTLRGNAAGVALAIALSRIAFGFQLQTISTLGPDLAKFYGLDYAMLGTLVGVYMAAGVEGGVARGVHRGAVLGASRVLMHFFRLGVGGRGGRPGRARG